MGAELVGRKDVVFMELSCVKALLQVSEQVSKV